MAANPKKTRLYRELLTPLLHRRFTNAASLVLCACYAETVLTRSWASKFWWIFPIGFAGIQSLLFFIPALVIFILRVSQAHFGLRTSESSFDTFTRLCINPSTYWTVLTYAFCGFFYGEVYMWTVPRNADLAWVQEGAAYERLHLNERPIFLRSNFLFLSLVQAAYHLWWDLSRVELPRLTPVTGNEPEQPVVLPPSQRSRGQLLPMIARSAILSTCSTLCSLIIYSFFLRQSAFTYSRSLGRIIWNISKNAEPQGNPQFHPMLVTRACFSGALMLFLWDFSNFVFGAYVAQPPTKKEKPLTEDSPDPNGSLLNGLKSKKELVRTFAFWELETISRAFEGRRKDLFADLDRSGGSAWTQLLQAALAEIDAIDTRISNKTVPPPELTLEKRRITPQRLPKIAAPLEPGMVLSPPAKPSNRRASYEARAGALAKSLGSSPPSGSPLRTHIGQARDHLLTPAQQQHLQPAQLSASLRDAAQAALRTPLGHPFRHSLAARARAKVLGTPYSALEPTLMAVGAVARLAGASVREDRYGTVHKDVAAILRALARTAAGVDAFVRSAQPHWTDIDAGTIDAAGGDPAAVPEIEQLRTHLRCALRYLIACFEAYAKDMGLGPAELREARKAAGLEST